MKVIIRSKIDSASSKEKIEKKFRSLEKFLRRFEKKEEAELELEISKDVKHNKGDVCCVEANLALSKSDLIRAKSRSSNSFLASNKVFDELKRQIRKRKESRLSRVKKGAQILKKLIHR